MTKSSSVCISLAHTPLAGSTRIPGALSGSSVGVKGEHVASGNYGYIGGEDYAGYFDGDVHVSDALGIGTEDPLTALHVTSGDIRRSYTDTSEYIELKGISGTGGHLTSVSPEDGKLWLRIQNLWKPIGSSGGQCEIKFQLGEVSSPITAMTIEESGQVGIGTADPGTMLAVAGLTGTSSYNNVKVNIANGNFYYENSTKRNKENIRPLEQDFEKIFQAQPKAFTDKASGLEEIGFIAEEFDALGLTDLVIYDSEGQPNGLKYERISLYLLEVLKDKSEKMSELESEVTEIRAILEKLVSNQQ